MALLPHSSGAWVENRLHCYYLSLDSERLSFALNGNLHPNGPHRALTRGGHHAAPPANAIARSPRDLHAERSSSITRSNTQKTSAEDNTGFRMSRIRAEGWKAALVYLASGDPSDEKKIAALNPHRAETERRQWFVGFNNALERR